MGVEKARFRNPVIPDCKLILKIEAIRFMEECGNIKEKHLWIIKKWQMQFGQLLLLIGNK